MTSPPFVSRTCYLSIIVGVIWISVSYPSRLSATVTSQNVFASERIGKRECCTTFVGFITLNLTMHDHMLMDVVISIYKILLNSFGRH